MTIQSTLVFSKSMGLSDIVRDTRTSTDQICRTEEKINRTTTFHKWICTLTPEVRNIFCYMFLDFRVKTGTRFSLRDKRYKRSRDNMRRLYVIKHLKSFKFAAESCYVALGTEGLPSLFK